MSFITLPLGSAVSAFAYSGTPGALGAQPLGGPGYSDNQAYPADPSCEAHVDLQT